MIDDVRKVSAHVLDADAIDDAIYLDAVDRNQFVASGRCVAVRAYR